MKRIKKPMSMLLSIILVITLLPFSVIVANAESATYYDGDWAYRIEGNYAVLVGVTRILYGEVAAPPSTLGGYPLKVISGINNGASAGIRTTQFIIPQGVERITQEAFNTGGFVSVVMPLSLKQVDFNAFPNCYGFNTIYYEGTYDDWKKISIAYPGLSNEWSINATRYYNYVYAVDESGEDDYIEYRQLSPGFHDENGEFELDSQWSFRLFDEDNCTYNHDLAMAAICLSQEIYHDRNSYNAINRLEDLGFKNISSTDNLFEGWLLSKEMKPPMVFGSAVYKSSDGHSKTVVAVAIQGTTNKGTVLTDLIDGGFFGFDIVSWHAFDALEQYAVSHNIQLDDEDTVFFITGHSLGGAVAGRLAIELKGRGYTNKAFVYTFASAKYSTKYDPTGVNYSSWNFPYVFNIVNKLDVVPKIPPWVSSSRIGIDKTFYASSYVEEQSRIIHLNPSEIAYRYYGEERLEDVYNQVYIQNNGLISAIATHAIYTSAVAAISTERTLHYHHLSTYLSYLLSNDDVDAAAVDTGGLTQDYWGVLHSIRCPVDIKLYDTAGRLLAYTESDTVTTCEEAPVFVMVDGEDKYVLAPSYYPLDIEIIGTGEGAMDYSVQKLAGDETVLEEVCFENVAIEQGKTMLSEVSDESKSTSETKLYVMESGERLAKISNDGNEIAREVTGTYDGFEYTLYNDGELRFDGERTLYFHETEDNPMLIYGERITSVVLGRNIVCEHCYDSNHVVAETAEDGTENVFYVCKMCLHKKTALKFYAASLTLQNNLKVNLLVDKTFFTEVGYTNPYVVFTLDGRETVVSAYTVSGNYYVFSLANIAPDQMNDTITAVLHATYDEVEYTGELLTYSIAQYCYSMLGKNNTADNLRTLLVNLLRYGAAAQRYTGHRTDALVDAALTAEQAAWGTTGDPALTSVSNGQYAVVDDPAIHWKGAGLRLGNAIRMQFYFTAESVADITVQIKTGDGEVLFSATKNDFTRSDDYYVLTFSGLGAGQLSEAVYVTAYRGETAVSNTVRYSVESYACAKCNDSDVNLATLVKAMMHYGNAAYAYVHNIVISEGGLTVIEDDGNDNEHWGPLH